MNRQYKRHRLRKSLIFLVLAVLLLSGLFSTLYAKRNAVTYTSENRPKIEAQEDVREVKEYNVKTGDTFSTIMESFGIVGSDINQMLAVSSQVYDFTKIKTGQLFRVIFAQNAFAAMQYGHGSVSRFIQS